VAAEADRGVARLPCRWGCRATAPPSTLSPGRRAVGLRPFPAPPSYLRHRTATLSTSEWPRRKYPEVRLADVFFFFDQRSVCITLPFVAAPSSTLPRMSLSLCLPKLQRQRSWSSHHRRCHHLFRRWRHPLPVLVKLAIDPSPRLLPFSRGYRRRCW
jgi:hypothetical protein